MSEVFHLDTIRPHNRPATQADLEGLPQHWRAEIIDGELFVQQQRPAKRHGRAMSVLGGILGQAFDRDFGGNGTWFFVHEPQLALGDHTLIPDIAGWRAERFPAGDGDGSNFDVSPDWICEALSPSTETYDRGRKREIYAEHAVSYIWLLDPRSQILETFTLQNDTWLLTTTFADADAVSAPPFDDLVWQLDRLWLKPPNPISR